MDRAHHVRRADATSDAAPDSIVELRRFESSDLPIEAQVHAGGATWFNRQLVGRSPASLSSDGFGQKVRSAMKARIEHLVGQGLARRQAQRVFFARDLLDTLRRRKQRLDLASGRFAMIDDRLVYTLFPGPRHSSVILAGKSPEWCGKQN
jgi:hypothetical protein